MNTASDKAWGHFSANSIEHLALLDLDLSIAKMIRLNTDHIPHFLYSIENLNTWGNKLNLPELSQITNFAKEHLNQLKKNSGVIDGYSIALLQEAFTSMMEICIESISMHSDAHYPPDIKLKYQQHSDTESFVFAAKQQLSLLIASIQQHNHAENGTFYCPECTEAVKIFEAIAETAESLGYYETAEIALSVCLSLSIKSTDPEQQDEKSVAIQLMRQLMELIQTMDEIMNHGTPHNDQTSIKQSNAEQLPDMLRTINESILAQSQLNHLLKDNSIHTAMNEMKNFLNRYYSMTGVIQADVGLFKFYEVLETYLQDLNKVNALLSESHSKLHQYITELK